MGRRDEDKSDSRYRNNGHNRDLSWYRAVLRNPLPPLPLSPLWSISQCTDNTRRQKAAIQLQNDLPLLFPVCQPAYLIPKATPSHAEATIPRGTPSHSPPAIRSRLHRPRRPCTCIGSYERLCMHRWVPSWLLHPPTEAKVAGEGRVNRIPWGDRTSTIGARWINMDRNVGRCKDHLSDSLLIRHFSTFFGFNLVTCIAGIKIKRAKMP